MNKIRVTVNREEFDKLPQTYKFSLPIKRSYRKLIPEMAFTVGENDCLLAEHPKVIVFRRKWSLKTCVKQIRLSMLIHSEEDGVENVYLTLYLL